MTVHFGYDKKQVLDALRSHFLTRREIRLLVIVVNVFAIISAILLGLKIIQALSFLIFSIMWIILWVTVRYILPSNIYKRSQTFRDEFSLNLTEEGVHLSTERGTHLWKWDAFSTFQETDYFFHLYFDNHSFFLIPKDAYPDLPSTQEARQFLKDHIKK